MASTTSGDLNSDPCCLPPEFVQVAFENFGETPEKRESAISSLREKITLHANNLEKIHDLSDTNLIRFIRGRNDINGFN